MGKNFKKTANLDRTQQEAAEGMKEQRVDAPASRFQDTQQVNVAESATATTTPDTNFVRKTVEPKGSQLKQEVASEVMSGSKAGLRSDASSISSPTRYGLKVLQYSGDTGTILGNASDTPTMGHEAQGRTRVDKRLSDPNKDINYLASEQATTAFTNVEPLAQSDKTVGYNGNPKNVAARSQKRTGGSSAELLFDRSLDFLAEDAFVFTNGQVVKQSGVDYGDYPTLTYFNNAGAQKDPVPFSGQRGNYAPREIQITLTRDSDNGPAYVSAFEVQEDDLSCSAEHYDTVNRAGTNEKIFINKAELARQRIDSKAGSPTQEHFNPLGRSVRQPTATVGYLRDVESVTGAHLFTAYKFANKARAYYLTRTMKDGQDIEAPAIDALYGHLMSQTGRNQMMDQYRTAWAAEKGKSPLYSPAGARAGSAAILLSIFDSVSKYKTKADLVTQPRGFKMHYQTADNNINPFRLEKNFAAALNSVDVFSTIDRGYDPMNAICMTDGVRLVQPYSWRNSLKFTRESYGAERIYDDQLFAYVYAAGNGVNRYMIKVGEPILNAIAYFAEMHAAEIGDSLGLATKANSTVTWHIPTVHYGAHFGLWDLLLCAVSPYIVYERTNAMKDVLDYEVNFEYPFDLVSIQQANPMNAVNYRNLNSLEPLISQTMSPSSAIRWTMPEMMRRIGNNAAMLPFYFSEDEYAAEGTKDEKNNYTLAMVNAHGHAYTTPVIRSGVRLAYLDDFWGMDAKDSQLCYDRMVRLPFSSHTAPQGVSAYSGITYKYSQDAEGIPVLTAAPSVTLADYLATPRQLGWFMPAPVGCCIREPGEEITVANTFASPTVSAAATPCTLSALPLPSMRAVKYSAARQNATAPAKQLGDGAVLVDRAQAFTQTWTTAWASGHFDPDFDLPLSIAGLVNINSQGAITGVTDGATFTPFIYTSYADAGLNNVYDRISMFSIHRHLWPIVQKLPFVLNPFDGAYAACGAVDPFSYAYIFGLAGFMSADYAEEDYNRNLAVLNGGFGYTQDPFVGDSPVFRDAYRLTSL